MAFYTYILKCADGSFYTGHTDNLDQRLAQQQSDYFTGYTFKRRPVELAWSENFATRYEALEAEKRIKGWTRAKKQALIDGDWELLAELARNYGHRG
ncbi:MAG: GIY-YIG nuclease family protein [Sphingomonadales bacterium]|nr:GIY-YIG nuclease family protein [Sphingomonadales bacterium]PIX65375.1 MAG: GIY-YIG nuclease family protein [Sphingomonadales bacterium CG_4_10_14_3_um_filter_58_15]NCO49546.1 GIY-YIG nuclease family protein [Sphingomonadales bacterium]NCP01139.1 GIY-YIG nuclease family protein [Sphingomonadales bacterium]NCP28078.1 GIY-YIG nuclease family protein [Sphingomonadales bacterium]